VVLFNFMKLAVHQPCIRSISICSKVQSAVEFITQKMLWPPLSQTWSPRKIAVQIMFDFVYDYKPLLPSHPLSQHTHTHTLLGTFTELQKVTISFVISVHMSVWPHGTTLLPQDGFSLHLVFECFSKISPENLSFMKIWQEQQVIYMKTKNIFDHMSLNYS
jgi:hypothetical protein